MFIFCSWPVWYNVYNVYIYRDIILINFSDASWRFFVRKYNLHSISLFFLNTCSMFAREYWVFPYLVLFYVHWTFFMNENLSQNIVLFFIFVCTARILLFLLLFIYYWNWRIKFVFYLHWLSCVLLLTLPSVQNIYTI